VAASVTAAEEGIMHKMLAMVERGPDTVFRTR
jgi:hypothetical protein